MQEPNRYGIEWAPRPEEKAMVALWQIKRAPDKGTMRGLILSHNVIGCYTHFWHNRTMPCMVTGCEACSAGRAKEWHGYIAMIDSFREQKTILEMTARAVAPVDKWFRDHRTLRGHFINVSRTSNKANGRQFVEVLNNPSRDSIKIECPDVMEILARLWRLQERPLLEIIEKPITGPRIAELNGPTAEAV